jgi:hypothetical protein
MRHRLAAAASALALTAVGAVGSSTSAEALPGTWTSPNVEHLLTIPDAAAVSAKFVNDATGKAQWMYLSTWQGLSIYDVSNPALPLLTAKLPLPNFENEDIDGNANIAIVSTDGLTGGVVYVIDTTNKRLPVIKSTYVAKEGAGHTSNCVDNCERYIYTATGDRLNVVDIADPANPKITLVDWDPAVGPAHDVDQDDSGIVWMTGYNGGAGFAIHPLTDGRQRRHSPEDGQRLADQPGQDHRHGGQRRQHGLRPGDQRLHPAQLQARARDVVPADEGRLSDR